MPLRCQRNTRLYVEPLERRELLSTGVSGLLQPSALAVAASVADDYGNTFAQAAQVSLSGTGSGSQSGKIEQARDVDMFRFVAPITGQMTITQSAALGSRLDSYLYVYSASQQLLARNDDSGGALNSQVQINVVAGTTYYVKAAAYGRSTGDYTLQSIVVAAVGDDYANDFAHAALMNVSSSGSGSQSGRVGQAGDVDMFRFVAPVTGQMTITQAAASGSRLDSYLYVYGGNQQLLGYNDDSAGTLNSQVQINVVAGATYYIKAGAYPGSSGAYTLQLSTVANAPQPAPQPASTPGGFQIDVSMSGLTLSQQQIVQQAVDRWEQIIVGDLPDVVYNGRTIDDVEIVISGVTIDAAGGILGQASATASRSGSDLPYLGFIQLDTADVAAMQTSGSLLGVLEHELAHVLGFGVIWSSLGLLSGTGTSNPGFTGPLAVAEYNNLFGTSATSVPVEADGGAGTRLSHWDETVFGTELMTGWYNSGQTNALSRITVASMADLGYQVNMAAADPFVAPASRSVAASAVVSSQTSYRSFGTSGHTSSRGRQADWLYAVDLLFRSEFAG